MAANDTLLRRKRTLEKARKHITMQGEVVYAANLLHDEFFLVFVAALSFERVNDFGSIAGASMRFHDHALAIWHVVQSDKAQRDMALEAISTVPTGLDLRPALTRLAWSKSRAAKLADYRNLAAHSAVLFSGRQRGKRIEMVPKFASHGARPTHERKLKLIDGLSFWRALRNDLLKLSEYVRGVRLRLMGLECARHGIEYMNAPKTWPDRPKLGSIARIQSIESRLAQAPRRAKRRSRRKASPP